jgi:hypothetical protein
MAFRGFREANKINWGADEKAGCTLEEINTGALLRIADATEMMAKHHLELQKDLDYWKNRAKDAERRLDRERRRVTALLWHMKRMKRSVAKEKE